MSSYLEISEALYDQIEPMRTIDTHEHLFEEPTRLADQLDFSSLFDAYANADLVSAGMSSSDHDRFMSPATDLDEKWRMAAPYWEAARHTGYSTAIRLTIRDLYGADDLNSSTYGPITEKMRAANKPGVNRSVLHDKAGIDWCIVHNLDGEQHPFRAETDRSLFKQVIVVAKFFGQETMVQELADPTGVAPDSWSAYKRVIDWYFEQYGEDAVAIKNNCPYWRNLRFDSVSDEDAAAIFERQYVRGESVTAAETKALQDATFRYCIGRAIEYDLPVQIHTGYLAGNWGMDVNRIRATDLTNLFGEYHEARFDLFHISYPYHLELGTLAKNYPERLAQLLLGLDHRSIRQPAGSSQLPDFSANQQDICFRRRRADRRSGLRPPALGQATDSACPWSACGGVLLQRVGGVDCREANPARQRGRFLRSLTHAD